MKRKLFATFRRGESRFAVDASAVREIAAADTVTPVPRASPWFAGLAFVRGRIVPVYDPALRLGLPPSPLPFARILLLETASGLSGIGVDSVEGMSPASSFASESREAFSETADTRFVRSFLRSGAEEPVIELDLSRFFVPDRNGKKETGKTAGTSATGAKAPEAASVRERLPETALLSAYVGTEEYGFLLESVLEVLKTDGLARVPETGTASAGVVPVRNGFLPVTDLRKIPGFYGNGTAASDEREEASGAGVVVLRRNEREIGILVDRFGSITKVPGTTEDFARGYYGSKTGLLRGIARPEGGNRLIFVLNEEKLFAEHAVRIGTGKEGNVAGKAAEKLHRVLVFRTGGNRFCLPIEEILEVGRKEAISPVPKAPGYFAGMVPFHGEPVPVLDLGELFRLAAERGPAERMIFMKFGGRVIGLLVDSVTDVLRIPADRLQPVPDAMASGVDANFLKGIYTLVESGSFLMLIDAAGLLTREEEKTIVREE